MATMTGSERIADYLREHGVPYSVEHHRLVFTAQEVAAEEHVSGKMVVKAVLVLADGSPHIILLPAHYHAHLGYLRRLLGASEVRLAHDAEIAHFFPDCEPGAVPPFGNLYGIPVHVHQALAERPEIVVQPGSHTATFRLRYADFARLVRPALVEAL